MSVFYFSPENFTAREQILAENASMSAVAFRYTTGVCALRIQNARGYFIVLPYNGHQIWRASFDDIDLTMKTGIEEPVACTDFIESYGCFMMHSGLCGVGHPEAEDNHKTHGDLPSAPFANGRILCGEDEGGAYIAVAGTYHHYASFTANYNFTSTFKLYENGTLIHLTVNIENLRQKPMEYAYLCHINFRPFDGAQLIYTAKCDAKHFHVHKDVPASMPENDAKALRAYMDAMQKSPEIQTVVDSKTQVYSPEIVSSIDYIGDENGMAHTMQYRKDGYACYVTHPINPLNNSIRWVARTGDEDAMGMVLPASTEHRGYTYAKRKGQIKTIDKSLTFSIQMGLLVPVESERMKEKIERILK